MSTLDLIRTLRRALSGLREAHDESAVAELARGLVRELNGSLDEPRIAALREQSDMADEGAFVDLDEIQCGGMAVCA